MLKRLLFTTIVLASTFAAIEVFSSFLLRRVSAGRPEKLFAAALEEPTPEGTPHD